MTTSPMAKDIPENQETTSTIVGCAFIQSVTGLSGIKSSKKPPAKALLLMQMRNIAKRKILARWFINSLSIYSVNVYWLPKIFLEHFGW